MAQYDLMNNHANSFDDCFTNYQQDTRLYVAPLVYTNGAWEIFDSSPLLWNDETNGFSSGKYI